MTQLRQNKDVRVFAWTVLNAIITLIISYATGSTYAVLLVPVLNYITKQINTKYFNDLGVLQQ